LERIEGILMEKVELAKQDLIKEGNQVSSIAEQFIRTKVKQNLFKVSQSGLRSFLHFFLLVLLEYCILLEITPIG